MEEAQRRLNGIPDHWRDDARFAYLGGRLAEQAGRSRDAALHYERAVATDPDYRDALYRLGLLLVQAGRGREGEQRLARAAQLAEREALLGTLMDTRQPAKYAPKVARMERALGHDRLADAWFAEAIRLNPNDRELEREAARQSIDRNSTDARLEAMIFAVSGVARRRLRAPYGLASSASVAAASDLRAPVG